MQGVKPQHTMFPTPLNAQAEKSSHLLGKGKKKPREKQVSVFVGELKIMLREVGPAQKWRKREMTDSRERRETRQAGAGAQLLHSLQGWGGRLSPWTRSSVAGDLDYR